jgi:hypothetical protein
LKITLDTSNIKGVLIDKIAQALLNQLPFITALFFLSEGYNDYYINITLVYLFISFSNLGIEKIFAYKALDISLTIRVLFVSRIVSAIAFYFFAPYVINCTQSILYIYTSIILFSITSITEFLYIGDHLKKPLYKIKLAIFIVGFAIRFVFRSIEIYSLILALEATILLAITIKYVTRNVVGDIPLMKINFTNYLESFSLLFGTFLVTKLYLFQPNDLNLKVIHYFDYLVVFSGLIASALIKSEIKINDGKLENFFTVIIIIVLFLALSIGESALYYIGAKILSAINVFVVYILLSRLDTRRALLVNLGSFTVMLSYFILVMLKREVNIFSFMLIAESTVVPMMLLIREK